MFGSPLRLDLCLRCTSETLVREMLDVWPSLPIEIMQMDSPYDGKSVIAALEHRDRVRDLYIFSLTSSLLGTTPCAETPSAFFPSETIPALPDIFLGGSAPRLQSLTPNNIPFQGLPRLLLSTTNLSRLRLGGIPDTGYTSPEAIATGLSALTRLTDLAIQFEYRESHSD